MENVSKRDFLVRSAAIVGGALLGSGAVVGALNELSHDDARITKTENAERFSNSNASGIERVIQEIAKTTPHIDTGMDPREYDIAISTSLEEKGIKPRKELRLLTAILALNTIESGFRVENRWAVKLPLFLEGNTDETMGPMEINVNYVVKTKGIPIQEARSQLRTVKGGVANGIEHLLSIIKGNSFSLQLPTYQLEIVLADWMAGPFSSRNAAFQYGLNDLGRHSSGVQLQCDGGILTYKISKQAVIDRATRKMLKENNVLLSYDSKTGRGYVDGFQGREEYVVKVPLSQTEQAIIQVTGIEESQVRKDCCLSRSPEFIFTDSYMRVMGSSKPSYLIPDAHRGLKKLVGNVVDDFFGESLSVRSYVRSGSNMFKAVYPIVEKHMGKAN